MYAGLICHCRRDFPNDGHRRWSKITIRGHREGSEVPASFTNLAAVLSPLVGLGLKDRLLRRESLVGCALCRVGGRIFPYIL